MFPFLTSFPNTKYLVSPTLLELTVETPCFVQSSCLENSQQNSFLRIHMKHGHVQPGATWCSLSFFPLSYVNPVTFLPIWLSSTQKQSRTFLTFIPPLHISQMVAVLTYHNASPERVPYTHTDGCKDPCGDHQQSSQGNMEEAIHDLDSLGREEKHWWWTEPIASGGQRQGGRPETRLETMQRY